MDSPELIYGIILIFIFFLFTTYLLKVLIGWVLNFSKLDDTNKNWLVTILSVILSSVFAYLIGWTRLEIVITCSLITSFIWFFSEVTKKRKSSFHKFLRNVVTRWILGILSFIVFFIILVNTNGLYDPTYIKPLIPSLLLLIFIVRKRKDHTQ